MQIRRRAPAPDWARGSQWEASCLGYAFTGVTVCHSGEPEEDGYQDEYQLEDVEIGPADYIKPVAVGNWR